MSPLPLSPTHHIYQSAISKKTNKKRKKHKKKIKTKKRYKKIKISKKTKNWHKYLSPSPA